MPNKFPFLIIPSTSSPSVTASATSRILELGISELQRVARPGARILILDFAKPDNAFFCALYFGYLRFFIPIMGRVFCGDAATHSYILESLTHYPAQHGVDSCLKKLGLIRTKIYNLAFGAMSINYAEKPGQKSLQTPDNSVHNPA